MNFKNPELLERALTHSSFVHENKDSLSNERLEFLGDSVLGLAVSETLMARGQGWSEGELSRLRSHFVSEATLAAQARKVDLGACLRLGKGERQSGGANRDAALADTVEALIAAVHEDQGYAAAARLVRERVLPALTLADAEWQKLALSLLEKDAKSRLQEFLQQEGLGTPRYVCLNAETAASVGPFEMGLFLGDALVASETAPSKKEATQQLARRLLAMSPSDLVGSVAQKLNEQKGLMTSGSPDAQK